MPCFLPLQFSYGDFFLFGPQSVADCGSGKQTQSSQIQEQQPENHTSSPVGDGSFSTNDAVIRRQVKGERWKLNLAVTYVTERLYVKHNWNHMSVFFFFSGKPRVEPTLAAAPQGHPQLHIQLQKFTVSADKVSQLLPGTPTKSVFKTASRLWTIRFHLSINPGISTAALHYRLPSVMSHDVMHAGVSEGAPMLYFWVN